MDRAGVDRKFGVGTRLVSLHVPNRRDSLADAPSVRERQRMEQADWLELRLPDRAQLPSPWRRLVAWAVCARDVTRLYDQARERYRSTQARCLAHRAQWLQDLQVQWEARYGEGPAGLRVCTLAGNEAQQGEARALLTTTSHHVRHWSNERLRASMDALALASHAHDSVVRTDLKRIRDAPGLQMPLEQAHRVAQALLDTVLTHRTTIAHALPANREEVNGKTALRSTWHDLIARQLRISVEIAQGQQHPAGLRVQDLVDAINDLLSAYGLPRRAAAITGLGRDDAAAVVVWR